MGTASVTVWQYKGSAVQLQNSALVNAFGPQQTGTITDANGVLATSDNGISTFQLSGGLPGTIQYVGAGTMSLATVGVLGLASVSLGSVPAAAFLSGGKIWLMLPQGFPNLLGFNLSSLSASFNLNSSSTFSLSGFVPCFAQGTRLSTDDGEVAVEDLNRGDMVLDHMGVRHCVLWHGKTRVTPMADWPDDPRHPVAIPANAFGPGRPRRELVVSQLHRIVLFDGEREVFAKAKFLVPQVARLIRTGEAVTYHHILTARHATLLAENLPTESFLPGPVALDGLERTVVAQIRAALGEEWPALSRPEVNRRQAATILRAGVTADLFW